MSRIIVPLAFRRTESESRTAARSLQLLARAARIQKAFWPGLNDGGRKLVTRAGFSAWLDCRGTGKAERAERTS